MRRERCGCANCLGFVFVQTMSITESLANLGQTK